MGQEIKSSPTQNFFTLKKIFSTESNGWYYLFSIGIILWAFENANLLKQISSTFYIHSNYKPENALVTTTRNLFSVYIFREVIAREPENTWRLNELKGWLSFSMSKIYPNFLTQNQPANEGSLIAPILWGREHMSLKCCSQAAGWHSRFPGRSVWCGA